MVVGFWWWGWGGGGSRLTCQLDESRDLPPIFEPVANFDFALKHNAHPVLVPEAPYGGAVHPSHVLDLGALGAEEEVILDHAVLSAADSEVRVFGQVGNFFR